MSVVTVSTVTSVVVSGIICAIYSIWWFHNTNKWVEEFIEYQAEEKKEFMKDFVDEIINKRL